MCHLREIARLKVLLFFILWLDTEFEGFDSLFPEFCGLSDVRLGGFQSSGLFVASVLELIPVNCERSPYWSAKE